MDSGYVIMAPIAEQRDEEVNKNNLLLCWELEKLAKVLEQRFRNDILNNTEILQK